MNFCLYYLSKMYQYPADIPENYKWLHSNRMYYANRCNYCFSSKNLKKCGRCEAVTYCSREHQLEDWPFHNPTCTALIEIKKKVLLPEKLNSRTFYKYRTQLASKMAEFRSLPHYSLLTDYEKQICMLPWVCIVCFKKPSKHFSCWKCLCIAYCSNEHKQADKKFHEQYCWVWGICRVSNSLEFEKGYQIQGNPFKYKGVYKNVTAWPRDMFSLCDILQETYIEKNERVYLDDCINVSVFLDPFAPAAIIINVFEATELIQKRYLVTKTQKTKVSIGRQRKLMMTREQRLLKKNSTFVIHFPLAGENELQFEWNHIAGLITEWITNIANVEVVLAGSGLRNSTILNFGPLNKIEVAVHDEDYEKLKNLPKPDVIIVLECDRYFGIERLEDLNEDKHKKPFFLYNDVPVIFCDSRAYVISQITQFYSDFQDIKCILPLHVNPFTEVKMRREWNLGFTASIPNSNCAVFTICK